MILLTYLLACITDGDDLNDWLTHIPNAAQPLALWLGHLLTLFNP